MKKFILLSLILSLLMVFSCMGVLVANAEPEYDSPVVDQPVETPTDYSEPDYSEPDYSDPDYTEPDYSEPDTEYTEPDNTEPDYTEEEPTEEDYEIPTEYEEEPDTYSDYESPQPIYTPGDQDYEKQEWQSLSLDVSNTNKTGGPGSFAQMKNDLSNVDKTNPVWIILCIIFWCLSLAAITFAILFKTKKAKKPAHSYAGRSTSSRSTRTPSPRYEKKYSDDYNDGF